MNNNRAVAVENKLGLKGVFVFNKNDVSKMVELFENSSAGCKCKVYDVNSESVPFEYLPEDVQQEVKETLKCFGDCHVEYCNGKMTVDTGWCLKAKYAADECVIGVYRAKEIYTAEELRAAHKEVFGYAF